MNKLPPVEKIYEAYSAIADNRVTMTDEQAIVVSSNKAKEYTVTWKEDIYTSNDSATYWQGYAGYPVIAVLMLQSRLSLDREISLLFSDVNWTELNQKYKRNYAKAVSEVLTNRQTDPQRAVAAANKVLGEIETLDIKIKRGSLRPPKSN